MPAHISNKTKYLTGVFYINPYTYYLVNSPISFFTSSDKDVLS